MEAPGVEPGSEMHISGSCEAFHFPAARKLLLSQRFRWETDAACTIVDAGI